MAQRTIATERSDSLLATIKAYEAQLKALALLPDDVCHTECDPCD